MCDLEGREVEELVRAVGVADISVAFVVGDLAGQWVNRTKRRRVEVNGTGGECYRAMAGVWSDV